MDRKNLLNDSSVMDDVNDLDAEFGYFRPLMDEEEEVKSRDDSPRRGRPPKDPASAMTDAAKAARRATLVDCYMRSKAKSS